MLGRKIVALAAAVLAPLGIVTSAGSANATVNGSVNYDVCYSNDCQPHAIYTSGWLTWNNRTATFSDAAIIKPSTTPSVQARFQAFAAGKQIGATQTRTVKGTATRLPYSFTIGDTTLPGGINEVRITVCILYSTGTSCGRTKQYFRF